MADRHPLEDAFRRHLIAARRASGLNMRDLAAKSGVPFNTISRAERGKGISFGHAARLAGTLGFPLDASADVLAGPTPTPSHLPRCVHCNHPAGDHSDRRDHRRPPGIPRRPWCHACEARCDYQAVEEGTDE